MKTNIYERKLNYGEQEAIFNKMVEKTEKYVIDNNIRALILGISGGADSTLMADVMKLEIDLEFLFTDIHFQ